MDHSHTPKALADGKFKWLHKQFVTTLMNQGSQLTSNNIIKHLEAEAQEAHANDSQNTHEAALAAKHKKSTNCEKTKTKCMNPNCLKPRHTLSKCWEKGGGAEVKAPEWFKEMKAKQQHENGHVPTEKDDDHSTGSESVAIFIHEERQDI